MPPVKLLIVEDDHDLLALLRRCAELRQFEVVTATTLGGVSTALEAAPFEVAVVDLMLGSESGLDAMRAIKARGATEIVVISATSSLASAIASYELEAFAFVPKPFDIEQLFATVERAIEHRRVVRANRRFTWEQALLNDVGEEMRDLVAPDALVERVLRRLMRGLNVESSAARLLNPQTGEYDVRVVSAPDAVHAVWGAGKPLLPRPSDRVLATRSPVLIDDLHEGIDDSRAKTIPLRSALSVPMFVGRDLIGVLSVGSAAPHRFTLDDQRLLGTVANQVAVAVQSARLHACVRAGKQEWEATFDAIGDAIGVFDRHGRLLRGNTGLGAVLRRPVTSLRGLSCDEIGLCHGPFPDCAVGRAMRGACAREEVTRGRQIFNVTTSPVLDEANGPAIVLIAKDMTPEIQSARRLRQMSDELAATNGRLVATVDRLKATQAQLLQAEKLSAIGQLVAGVAHELNNPLTSVIGYAQLLQEEIHHAEGGAAPRPPAELAHDLRRIAEESERAARIVRNLLAFARRQSAARREQDVADLMNRVLALRAYEFRLNAIELATDFEPGLPPVLGDGGQLQQALLNLLLNAEQAMRTRPERRLRVAARRVADADAVEISIADTGQGIPGENLRRIFDPFFTTREVGEGTGLGLSICYGIVRDHGGQIAVESRVGQGTTFTVLLPAHSIGTAEPLRILVTHRDATERDFVAAALSGWGHTVIAAETAKDAHARLAAGAVDVVFIDEVSMTDDAPAWKNAWVAAGQPAVIRMTEAAGEGGVAPPYDLAALKAALRGTTKECV